MFVRSLQSDLTPLPFFWNSYALTAANGLRSSFAESTAFECSTPRGEVAKTHTSTTCDGTILDDKPMWSL